MQRTLTATQDHSMSAIRTVVQNSLRSRTLYPLCRIGGVASSRWSGESFSTEGVSLRKVWQSQPILEIKIPDLVLYIHQPLYSKELIAVQRPRLWNLTGSLTLSCIQYVIAAVALQSVYNLCFEIWAREQVLSFSLKHQQRSDRGN